MLKTNNSINCTESHLRIDKLLQIVLHDQVHVHRVHRVHRVQDVHVVGVTITQTHIDGGGQGEEEPGHPERHCSVL